MNRQEAIEDLLRSIEIDNTAGNTGDEDHPSHMVMGNVDDSTLIALGLLSDPLIRKTS